METRRRLLNLTTATKESPLTGTEREEFLRRRLARASCYTTAMTAGGTSRRSGMSGKTAALSRL